VRRTTNWACKRARRARLVLASALLLGAGLGAPEAAHATDEVQELRDENARLREEVERLRQQQGNPQAAPAGVTPAAPATGRVIAHPPGPDGTAQEEVEIQAEHVPMRRVSLQVNRDPSSGATSYSTPSYRTIDEGPLPMREWIHFRAIRPPEPGTAIVWMTLDRRSARGSLAGTKTGQLRIDGTIVELPVVQYDAKKPRRQGRGPRSELRDEQVTFVVPRDAVLRLMRANAAHFEAGTTSFELTDDHMAAFSALSSRLRRGASDGATAG